MIASSKVLRIAWAEIFSSLCLRNFNFVNANICTVYIQNAQTHITLRGFGQNVQYGQEMQDREDEMNGVVTSIGGSRALRARKREEVLSRSGSTSSPTHSLPKEELANAPVPGPRMDTGPHPRGRCLRTILQVGRLVRFLNCCHVENPHYIDNYSRLTFPLSFIFINLLYWTYYLYF